MTGAQISDDEDDTHPNIDTPSLFRWRHQARMERMERDQKEKEEFKKGFDEYALWFFAVCIHLTVKHISIDCTSFDTAYTLKEFFENDDSGIIIAFVNDMNFYHHI